MYVRHHFFPAKYYKIKLDIRLGQICEKARIKNDGGISCLGLANNIVGVFICSTVNP